MRPEDILAFDEKYVFNQMHNRTAYGLIINHNNGSVPSESPLEDRLAQMEKML